MQSNAPRILLVVPVCLFLFSLVLVSAWGPYYVGGRIDPEYFELTNAMSALGFRVPPNTDHPGTTVHVLTALVFLLKWMFGTLGGGWQPLEHAVFLNPEDFLHAVNLVINVLVGIAIYGAGRALYSGSGSVSAAVVLQGSVFLFPQILIALCRVAPEPLLVALGFALMIPLIRMVYSSKLEPSATANSIARQSGILFGLALVTKASAFPLAAVVLVLRDLRQRLWFAVGAASVVLVLLLPSAAKAPEKLSWFIALGTHTGFYGSGARGLAEPGVLWGNTVTLYQYAPTLFFLVPWYIAGLALACFKRFTPAGKPGVTDSGFRMGVLSGCLAILIGVGLILAHFRPHYLVPFVVWTCFLNAMLVARYQPLASRYSPAWFFLLIGSLVGAFGLWSSVHSMSLFATFVDLERREATDIAAELKKRPECLQVGYYVSTLPLYALQFGNGMASMHHGQVLADLYPNALSYSAQEGSFRTFAGENRTEEVIQMLKSGKCILAQGKILAPGEMVLPQLLVWRPVFVGPNQGIYLLQDPGGRQQ